MTSKPLKNAGFTIIELMVATVVFSMVLLICTYGVIHVGNDYYKGITEARTQDNARAVMDRISQDIQFSGGTIKVYEPVGDLGGFCVGSHLYSFLINKQLKPTGGPYAPREAGHVMIVQNVADCDSSTPINVASVANLTGSQEELISPNVRIQPYDGATHQNLIWTDQPTLYNIGIKLVYGPDDVLDGTQTQCQAGSSGRFCAVSTLLSSVQRRFRN